MATTTLSGAHKQGETYILIADDYLYASPGGPIGGQCTINGIAYTYQSATKRRILVTPTSGAVGLRTDLPDGTVITTA